jgi:branched-chain amino acid transport system permease protein
MKPNLFTASAKWILLGAVLASLGVSSFSHRIDDYFLDVIVGGIGINIILAVSLNLINGYTGQFSLGHAGFMAVGGYTSAMLTIHWGPPLLAFMGGEEQFGAVEVLFLGALLAGGIVSGFVGLLVGIPSLRLKGDYLAIVTLGFGEIIRVILQNMQSVGGALGLKGIPSYTTFFWTFGLAAVTIYVVVALVHSTYGRGFLAVHDDEVAAEAIGINTTRYKVTAFVIGAFFAGLAGGLYGHFKQFLTPEGFNFMKSMEIVVMVILGGMGNTPGVVVAAILLTILPEVLRGVAEYRMIIYSLLLIILMLTRPQGLFQWRTEARLGATK